MEFGRIENINALNINDFKLPYQKQEVLPGKFSNPKIYVGLPKWGSTKWAGQLYPERTREKEYSLYYMQRFNCIELNATHYKIYGKPTIDKWTEKLGEKDFKFCPKMYQGITHRGSLKGKDFITNEFFISIREFGKYLGPTYIQMSEAFSPKRKDELYQFLERLPKDFTYFLEVRHADWFNSNEHLEELASYLRKLNIGFVITDTPGRRDVVHLKLTIPQAMIRFSCDGIVNEIDNFRIAQWKDLIQKWFDNGMQNCYFFLHVQNEGEAISVANYVEQVFNGTI